MKTNYHQGNYLITSIVITAKGSQAGEITGRDSFWAIHGIGQLIGWNLLVTIGYIAARFLKHYPWWLILHFLGGTIPAIFSVVIIAITFAKGKFLKLILYLNNLFYR